jgi:hypothetical protein
MTEPENFLERWSRRKRSAVDTAVPEKDEIASQEIVDATPAPTAGESGDAQESKPFDPASLPSIESINANTDVRAFLLPGVPPELTRAALRRAWSADPAIRDFVGLVENGWDFNDPTAMAGFGPITPQEVARLLTQAVSELPAEAASAPAEPPQVAASERDQDPNSPPTILSESSAQLPTDQSAPKLDIAAPKPIDVQCNENDAATQNPGNLNDITTKQHLRDN